MASSDIVIVIMMGGAITAAAWWYFSQKGAVIPGYVGDCQQQGDGTNCMSISCAGKVQTVCGKSPSVSCADVRAEAVAKCPATATGPGGVYKEANCDYYPSSGNYCWHPVGANRPTDCAKGSCAAARAAYLQAFGGGGGGGVQPCVTDCACVRGANPNIGAICPAGARSCTACWRRRGSTTQCTPSTSEISAYGLSCAPSTGQPSVLFGGAAGYVRSVRSSYTQIRGTQITGSPAKAASTASSYRPQTSQRYPSHYFKDQFR